MRTDSTLGDRDVLVDLSAAPLYLIYVRQLTDREVEYNRFYGDFRNDRTKFFIMAWGMNTIKPHAHDWTELGVFFNTRAEAQACIEGLQCSM